MKNRDRELIDVQLRFSASEINDLAKRYRPEQDEDALEAGRRIAGDDYSRTHVETIFRWKTSGRGISRLASNTDGEIADALRLAMAAETERSALAVLVGLNGVNVPVASALLTAIDPERYTVIDFRALEALGVKSQDRSINFYLKYLATCRKLADQHKVCLRDLDRALWQWSKEHPEGGR